MASTEIEKSSKEKDPKTPSSSSAAASSSSQEPSPAVSAGTATPDWSSFQAYSPMPPHGFVASSARPHPYMWGVQHMMPPYGTPPHQYVTMYPPGGMYAHPSMPPGSYPYSPYDMPSPNGMTEASGNTSGGTEGDSEKSDVKEKLPIRRSRGRLITGKNNEPGKNSGASANGAYSKSGESASDGLSEGSDANSQNDSGSGQDRKDAANSPKAASENGGSANDPPVSQTVPIMPKTAAGVPGRPSTNLNSGMGKVYQDERELKRQRRKQSNREAAQRSRLRKQGECDKLAEYTEVLNAENVSLKAEMNRLKRKFEELTSENTSLKDHFLSFPPLESIKIEKDDQEPYTVQTGFTETKFVSYKDST